MGWSARNEQATGARGYAEAGRQEEKPETCTQLLRQGRKGENVPTHFSAGKLELR